MVLGRTVVKTVFCVMILLSSKQILAQEIATGLTGGGQPHNNIQPYIGMQYAVATDPGFSTDAATSNHILGEVAAWPYPTSGGSLSGGLPGGWTLADGQLLDIAANSALFAVLGTTYGGDGITTFALPDLRGRTPVGVGSGPGLSPVTLGQQTGVEAVTLTEQQIPSHDHSTSAGMTPLAGGSASHTNLMPGLGIRCLIAFSGIFPSRSRIAAATRSDAPVVATGGSSVFGISGEQFLAEMRWYAGTLADTDISGWAECDGRSVMISTQQAMFSLLGTTYGGDGRTTFNYPDLRGRIMLHNGRGTGLSTVNIGQRSGSENTTITTGTLPAHTHTVAGTNPEETSGPTGSGLAHDNRQPYLAINRNIALFGLFPGSGTADEVILGQTLLFAGNFAPRSFASMAGQNLTISSNTALYALILDTFGGDNETFLRLPQGQGRTVVGSGQGTGLTDRTVGEIGGEETHTLTVAEMPEHRHGRAPDDSICWSGNAANGAVFAICL